MNRRESTAGTDVLADLLELRNIVHEYGIDDDSDGFAICYGSTIGSNSRASDLDMLIVESSKKPPTQTNRFVASLIALHERTGRELDTEVPYDNKLFYSTHELDDSLALEMFHHDGKFSVPTLENMTDTDPYFSSPDMKLRLCFNALTTSHVLLAGSEALYLTARFGATKALGQLVSKLAVSGDLLHGLETAPNGATRKDFLGYSADDIFFQRSLEQYRQDIPE